MVYFDSSLGCKITCFLLNFISNSMQMGDLLLSVIQTDRIFSWDGL